VTQRTGEGVMFTTIGGGARPEVLPTEIAEKRLAMGESA